MGQALSDLSACAGLFTRIGQSRVNPTGFSARHRRCLTDVSSSLEGQRTAQIPMPSDASTLQPASLSRFSTTPPTTIFKQRQYTHVPNRTEGPASSTSKILTASFIASTSVSRTSNYPRELSKGSEL